LSCLASLILRRYRRWICESPHGLALPSSVSQLGFGLPRTPRLRVLPAFDLQVALNLDSFRRFQRFSSSGFPRNSISPVAPLDASRVSPVFASSGLAGDRSSGCPVSRVLQRLWCAGLGFPAPRSSSCACRYIPRVAPVPASSGFAGNGSSSYPESLVLRCLRCLSSRSPSNSAPPGCSSRCRCRFPRLLHLPAWPRV